MAEQPIDVLIRRLTEGKYAQKLNDEAKTTPAFMAEFVIAHKEELRDMGDEDDILDSVINLYNKQ